MNKKSQIKVISILFVLLFIIGIAFVVAADTKTDYLSTSDYEFSYDSKTDIYSNDLASVRTEIDNGDVSLSKWDKEVSLTIGKPNVYPALSVSSADTEDNKFYLV